MSLDALPPGHRSKGVKSLVAPSPDAAAELARLKAALGSSGQDEASLSRLVYSEAHYRTLFETAGDAIFVMAD